MELHESLYALGQSQGRALFDDPDGFRGALDDYLDEDAASTGDINLLVDAVRLGAFSSMQTMLDSGADPARAVQEAGSRLARDRGSSDVAGAQWALAVLGFAVGKVSDAQVRSYRSQHVSGSTGAVPPGGSTTAPPSATPRAASEPTAISRPSPIPGGQPAQPGQPGQPGQTGQPFGQTGQPYGQTGQPYGQTGQPYGGPPSAPSNPQGAPVSPYAQSPVPPPPSQPSPAAPGAGWSQGSPAGPGWQSAPVPPPAKKSKAVPILVAAVVLVLLLGGGIFAIVKVAGGGDDNGGGGGGGGGGDELSLDNSAVDDRYSALGSSVTSGTDGCESADAASGETEHLTCSFTGGTLDLVTYESEDQVQSARTRTITYDRGARSQQWDSGDDKGDAYYSFDPKEADDDNKDTVAQVYWDVPTEKVSADIIGDDGTALSDLDAIYQGTSPEVAEPTGMQDPKLIDFVDDFIKTKTCNRSANLFKGELEENKCAAPGQITVFGARFESKSDFLTYRNVQKQLWTANPGSTADNWNFAGGSKEGAYYLYTDDNGYAVLYWDQPDCSCYAQAYLTSGDTATLESWWQNA